MEHFLNTASPEETFRLGEKFSQSLTGGEVICLSGELGTGKTVLAKGLGKGLGIKEEITSPTFTLIQEYDSQVKNLRFIHMDLYRLRSPEEAEAIGVPDYFQNDSICLLEWPEIIGELLPEDRLDITIEGSGDLPRLIRLSQRGEDHRLLDSILAVLQNS